MITESSHPASSPRWLRPDRAIRTAAAALLAMALLLPGEAGARTRDLYVSPTGSDKNPGTMGMPFQSIARAAHFARPGTTVHVAPGVYEGGFATKASGSEDQPIRYISTQKWGAKIVPPTDSPNKYAWNNRGANVRIEGFEVDGSRYRGGVPWRIGLYTAGDNSVIENSKVHAIALDRDAAKDPTGGAGVYGDGYFGATNITLANNLVYGIGPAGVTSSLVHGIYMTTTGKVANNEVYEVVGAGIHLWHDARQVVIAGNRVQASNYGILVGGGDYVRTKGPNDNTVVQDNIVQGNRKCGVAEQGDTGVNNRYLRNLVFGNGRDWCLQNGLVAVDSRTMPTD